MDTLNPMAEKDDLQQEKIVPEQEGPTQETPENISEETVFPASDEETAADEKVAEEKEPEEKSEEEIVEAKDSEEKVADTEVEPAKAEEEQISAEKAVEEIDAVEKAVDEDVAEDDEDEDGDDQSGAEAEGASRTEEMTKQELCARLKELLDIEDVVMLRGEVEAIKQSFYKKSKAETEQERAEYIKNGGNELDFIPSPTELEEEFKALLNEYKNRKAKFITQQEKEKENNLLKKTHIIEQMKTLVESKEDVSANISAFRQLQQDWKATGPVPVSIANELWRQYNTCQESFWDLIKINNELREYDFRKNLEAKTKLIEIAESLDEEKDVVTAFRQLQKLHEEWHELGPVARELREETWNKFKTASSIINKKHQSHFDEIRKIEEENLEKKTALCERVEAVDVSKFASYKDWDGATKEVLNLQEEWRQIGFAPRKANQKIFERYRKACDAFFTAKAEFYKEVKAGLNENLEKKRALCEKAEALKDSTDWRETAEMFIQIQKEWKTIGPTPKKYADEVWKRFITACDYFFEQKNKNESGKRGEELQNLGKKKELIEKIKAFEKSENPGDSLTALRALAAEWNGIGHVPFREKDKLYKEYRAALDAQFDALNISASQRRLESFKSNLKDMAEKGESKLYHEREKLVRTYEHLKAEIATYENNIGFLSIASKKGGGMLQEMERKIESLKEECNLLEKKINMIDENI